MGQEALSEDPRFAGHSARGENMAAIDAIIGDWTSTLSSDVLLKVMEENGVPAGRIYTASDMLTDPQYAARDMVVELVNRFGTAVPAAGIVPKFSRTHPGAPLPGPELGRDTRQVLTTLAGVDADEWEKLAANGVALQAD